MVHNLSLEINTGEVVGLLGPNGAGKTTAFYMIVGLIRADAGTIRLDGQDLTSLGIDQRARWGWATCRRRLRCSAADGGREHHGDPGTGAKIDRTEQLRRCKELLSQLHIEHVSETYGMSLSGGERRRVEIARALAASPRFILLDEPFAGSIRWRSPTSSISCASSPGAGSASS